MSTEEIRTSPGRQLCPLVVFALGLGGACAGTSAPTGAPSLVGPASSSSSAHDKDRTPALLLSAEPPSSALSGPILGSTVPMGSSAPSKPLPVAPGPVTWASCPAAWTAWVPANFEDFSTLQGDAADAVDWKGIWSDGPPGSCTHLFAIGRDAAGDARLYGATCGKQRRDVYAPALSGGNLKLDFLINGMDKTEQIEVDRKGERAEGVRQVVNEDGPTGTPLKLVLQRRCH